MKADIVLVVTDEVAKNIKKGSIMKFNDSVLEERRKQENYVRAAMGKDTIVFSDKLKVYHKRKHHEGYTKLYGVFLHNR